MNVALPKCSRFVEHLRCIIPPTLLQHWEIDFTIRRLEIGTRVSVPGGTYYEVIIRGSSVTESRIWAPSDWWAPTDFVECNNDYDLCPLTPTRVELLKVTADAKKPQEIVDVLAALRKETDDKPKDQREFMRYPIEPTLGQRVRH